MKTVDKQECIIHYSIDPYFFENHSELERSYTTYSNWRRGEGNTYILNHGISFSVVDKNTRDQCIRFENRLKLQCIVDDISVDSLAILKAKEELHLSANEFLKMNSFSFFDRLKFPAVEFAAERALREEEAFIIMTKDAVALEDKSEHQLNLEKTIDRNHLAINIDKKE
ncbi:hypothetical protein [Mucilaginibacter psychrotolerans]|uniref:Uncharacterized protein n=1 Tax=Mucilaginibacter psychrotolerans TaxID=1524096 RepID=A0A4Y8S980_9SPHI|nr:hypothetical protein [Mucilaginibacter psychrotolerans]TFF35221.1 hypothetical protein E2R66_19860 [Mucilaginibacter psychrotolerans]